MVEKKIKKLLALYKKRIKKAYLEEIDKGLVTTYVEGFASDLLVSLNKKERI